MTGERVYVVFGGDWGRHVSTMEQIFGRLTSRATVVWINSIGHREPTFGDVPRAARKVWSMLAGRRGQRQSAHRAGGATGAGTSPPQVIVPPRVAPWHSNPLVARGNRWSLERDIARALARVGPHREVVLVTGSPPSAGVVGRCGEQASIYFCMDDFLTLPGTTPGMLAPLERDLLARVDAVVATASALVESKRCAAGPGYLLPQGVNFDHFAAPAPLPERLRGLPRPIVGFAGTLDERLDVGTLRAIAARNAGGSLVLVGRELVPLDGLDAPNVHRIGMVPYAEVPGYVQAFDAAVIPYVDNECTRAIDPLKLLEYLAAGVPVVTSPLREARKYDEVIETAPLGDAFASAVMRVALAPDEARRARGRRVAGENTWEHRAGQFTAIVDEVLARRGAGPAVPAMPIAPVPAARLA